VRVCAWGTWTPLAIYDFSTGRSKKRPLKFLEGYEGDIHAAETCPGRGKTPPLVADDFDT